VGKDEGSVRWHTVSWRAISWTIFAAWWRAQGVHHRSISSQFS